MRFLVTVVIFIGVTSMAQAKVPYNELDALRRKTIVVRSVMDNPEQAWVKKCVSAEKRMMAGSRLALATDNAAAHWKKQTITKADMMEISQKIKACESRGSCSVYEVYLGAVQIPADLTEMAVGLRSELEKKLEAMTSSSYQNALADIKQPCVLLKALTKGP